MSKKLVCFCAAILLSACRFSETKTTTIEVRTSGSGMNYNNISSRDHSYGGILDRINLNFSYDYKKLETKNSDGSIINEFKIKSLPESVVMRPRFTSENAVGTYLKESGARIEEAAPSDGVQALDASHLSPNSSSKPLNKVIDTPAYERDVSAADIEPIRELYQSVFEKSAHYPDLSIVPLWKDSEIKNPDMRNQLYTLLFSEARDAAEANKKLDITVFATNDDQKEYMYEAWDALARELKLKHRDTLKGSSKSDGSSLNPFLKKALDDFFVNPTSKGSASISGAATNFGNVRLIGVAADSGSKKNQSTLMVGLPMGQHIIAVGTEIGFENETLNYSMAKLLGLFNVCGAFKLSGGVAATHEKTSIFGEDLSRYGTMIELGAHYCEQVTPSLGLSFDAGLRGAFAGSFELGWFGQLSLDSGAFKAIAFSGSNEVGFNFGIEQ